jgi:hypothetical protein
MFAHPRLVSIQKKCKTPIEICEKSKKRLQLPLFGEENRERDEPSRWMCMRLGERAHPAGTEYFCYLSLSRLSLTLYCSEHTDAPFLLFVHLRAYQNVCTNSRAQVKARVEQNMSLYRRASTFGCGIYILHMSLPFTLIFTLEFKAWPVRKVVTKIYFNSKHAEVLLKSNFNRHHLNLNC